MNAPTRELLRVNCRWMCRPDVPAVLAIERASFPVPWTEDDFLAVLRRNTVIGHVAVRGETVVGFMLFEIRKTRIHVLNFAVAPGARRMGVGAQMVVKLVGKLSTHRRPKLVACVREHNDPAIRFWSACGFKATGVLRNYYGDEDAIRFKFAVGPEVSPWQ